MLKTEDCAPFLAMVPVVDSCRFFWRLLAGLRDAINDGGGLGSVRIGLGEGSVHVGDVGALSNSLRKTNIMMYQNMLSSNAVRLE